MADLNDVRAVEVAEFQRAHDFLLRVRNELHFLSPRATDVMNLDQQPRIAEALGFTGADPLAQVEAFMQEYYRAAQTVFRVSKLVEDRLARSIGRGGGEKRSFKDTLLAARFQRARRLDGFIVRGRELAADQPTVFQDDPVRLIRVFRHSQTLNAPPDLHPREPIRDSLPPLTREVAASADAPVSFRAILGEVGPVEPVPSRQPPLGGPGPLVSYLDGPPFHG